MKKLKPLQQRLEYYYLFSAVFTLKTWSIVMKKAFIFLLQAIGMFFVWHIQPAAQKVSPMQSLHGAYTRLPLELKQLSIIDGAIAFETKMIERLYKETESDKIITKPSLSLVKNLFYQIPGTNDFGLSKNIFKDAQKEEVIKKFIHNLVYLFITQSLEDFPQHMIKGSTAKAYTRTIKKTKDSIVALSPITKEAFLAASNEIARLALLASLWYIKKNVQKFDYEKLLQKELKHACDTILMQNKLPPPLKAKIELLNQRAKEIKTTTDIQYNIQQTFQNTKTLLQQDKIVTLQEEEYEDLAISFIDELLEGNKHPQAIKQTVKAKVLINEKPFSFANCVEISLLNIINYLAYNQAERRVSAKHLQSKLPNTPQPILDFYKKYERIINLNLLDKSNELKNEWSALTCQIPGIRYKKELCEIEANTANSIIALNHLLGCGWFQELQEHPQDELTFIKKHLAKLIKLFEPFKAIRINNQEIIKWDDKKELENIDLQPEYNDIEILYEHFSLTLEIRDGHCVVQYPTKFIIDKEFAKNLYQQYPTLYLITPINRWHLTLGASIFPSFLAFFAHPINQKKFVCELEEKLQNCSYFWIPRLEKLVQKYCTKYKIKTFTTKIYQIALQTINQENISQQNKQTVIKKNLEHINQFFDKTLPFFTGFSLHGDGFFSQSFLQTNFNQLKNIIQNFYPLEKTRIKNSTLSALNAIYNLQPLMINQDIIAMLSTTKALLNADNQDQQIRETAQTLAEKVLQAEEKTFKAWQNERKIRQEAVRLLQAVKNLTEQTQ